MNPMASQNIAAIGTFLTLVGLLGTFFYVHLTTWLRDLLALRAKFDVNDGGNTPSEEQAIRECRYSLKGLYNYLPALIAVAISAFIAFVAWNAFDILGPVRATDPLAEKLTEALIVFLAIYAALVIYLLIHGYAVGARLRAKLPR